MPGASYGRGISVYKEAWPDIHEMDFMSTHVLIGYNKVELFQRFWAVETAEKSKDIANNKVSTVIFFTSALLCSDLSPRPHALCMHPRIC